MIFYLEGISNECFWYFRINISCTYGLELEISYELLMMMIIIIIVYLHLTGKNVVNSFNKDIKVIILLLKPLNIVY